MIEHNVSVDTARGPQIPATCRATMQPTGSKDENKRNKAKESICMEMQWFALKCNETHRQKMKSGRADSNRRRPAWEAGILPLNYARNYLRIKKLQILYFWNMLPDIVPIRPYLIKMLPVARCHGIIKYHE